jgi:hypothetical protein
MSRKRQIPGVDEEALAALAEQFPSSAVGPREPPREAQTRDERRKTIRAVPPVDPVSPVAPIPPVEVPPDQPFPPVKPAAAVAPQPPAAAPKPRGRGLAIAALKLASVAALLAAAVYVPPQTRSWLAEKVRMPEIARAVSVGSDADPRLAAAVQSIGALDSRTAGVTARLDALETAAGSGLAQRVAALEASLKPAADRSAADAAVDRAAAAQADALDTRLAAFDSDLKKLRDSLAATERSVDERLGARLGSIEADIGVLQHTDRRPEKFFLAALQLRDAVRTASPFAREVAAARAFAGVNSDVLAALEVLAANAPSGVATIAELRDSFSTMLVPRLAAAAAANRQPLTERAWGWVGSLFATAASPATDDRNGTLIALASHSLEQGQLPAAVHQLLLLEDEPALLAAEWLKDASTRLAVDKAIATVMTQALDQLAASEPKN